LKKMQSIILVFFALLTLCFFGGCEKQQTEETSSVAYIKTTLSQQADDHMEKVAKEQGFGNQTSKNILSRSSAPNHVVILYEYAGENGTVSYGLEYYGDDTEGYTLLREGTDVDGDLLNAPVEMPSSLPESD
jgi:hypothetical protein